MVRRAEGRVPSSVLSEATENGSTGALWRMVGDRGREHVKSPDGQETRGDTLCIRTVGMPHTSIPSSPTVDGPTRPS
jgi:hypothetical protein